MIFGPSEAFFGENVILIITREEVEIWEYNRKVI